MKLSKIVSRPFSTALGRLIDTKLPIVTAYKLKTITTLVEAEQAKFEDLRRSLVDKYAEKDESGNIKKSEDGTYRVAEASTEDYLKEVNELLELEIEVPTVKLAALGEKAELTAKDLAALDGLLVE